MNYLRISATLGMLAFSAGVRAHHANTPYDMSQTLHASGIVQKADFKNPHSSLTLLVEDEEGTQAVTFDGHSLATLRHYGLGPSMVQVGDAISISYAPRRDNQPGGIFLSVTTAAGAVLDFSHLGYN